MQAPLLSATASGSDQRAEPGLQSRNNWKVRMLARFLLLVPRLLDLKVKNALVFAHNPSDQTEAVNSFPLTSVVPSIPCIMFGHDVSKVVKSPRPILQVLHSQVPYPFAHQMWLHKMRLPECNVEPSPFRLEDPGDFIDVLPDVLLNLLGRVPRRAMNHGIQGSLLLSVSATLSMESMRTCLVNGDVNRRII